MTQIDELLVLRLGLLAVIFLFILIVAATLRAPVVRAGRSARSEREAAREPRLVVMVPGQTGLARGTEFLLGGELTIGRDEENGIVIDDESVSRRHALVRLNHRGAEIADLGSSNGTVVNDESVGGRARRLRDGDTVRLGAIAFQYRD
jgi:hypothetical protein